MYMAALKVNRRAIAICGPGTVRSSRLRNVMTALPSRPAASYQARTSWFFDILWVSMFLVCGVSLVQQCCAQKISGQCLLAGFVFMPMAVVNDSCGEFVRCGVGYILVTVTIILCSTDCLCLIVTKNPFHDFI